MQFCSAGCQRPKTSYSHQAVSLFAIISTYPTAHKGLPKFQWQQRLFFFIMPGYHFCDQLNTALPHIKPWSTSLIVLQFNKKHSTSEESWTANLTFFSAEVRNFTSVTKEERLVRNESIDNVIYGTKEVSPSGSKETHNFDFSRTSTSNEMKRTVFLV